MIIPIKCFTCGNVLANKYRYYCQEVRKRKITRDLHVDKVIYLTPEYSQKTPEGEVLDELNLLILISFFLSAMSVIVPALTL